jgi:hypothetical protein
VTAQPPRSRKALAYTERLYSPWWWYPAALGVALLLGAEIGVAINAWWAWIPTVVVIAICLLVVWRLSSGLVSVSDTELLAGDQTVPLARIDAAIGLSGAELRRLVGRHGDPLAFNFIRSWVRPGVQFVLRPVAADGTGDQSPDPTPYWLVSTRHPERLLSALSAASVPVR